MSQWYIGDPCYAIKGERWDEFCKILFTHPEYHNKLDTLGDGEGIEMQWKYSSHLNEELEEVFAEATLYIYDSPFGDGVWNIHGHKLGVDAGLLSVLPIEVCDSTDGGAVVESKFRPVFATSEEFPHVQLDIAGDIQQDTSGHLECSECGEWVLETSVIWSNHQGAVGDCCYEDEEDEEGDEDDE